MFSLDGLPSGRLPSPGWRGPGAPYAANWFLHRRLHNIYFRDNVEGLPADHPALRRFETINHTVSADQLSGSLLLQIYEWPPLANFLAATMNKAQLCPMADPLARVNFMAYRQGEVLNWHFDRLKIAPALLIQAPEAGGEFEYRSNLRSDKNPNYEGVAKQIQGLDPEVAVQPLSASTLNVFRGQGHRAPRNAD